MAQLVIYLSTWQMRRAGRHNFLHKTAPTDWQALHFIPRICFECHSERNFKFQRKISIPHFSDELSALLKRNQFQSLGRITKSSLYLGIFWWNAAVGHASYLPWGHLHVTPKLEGKGRYPKSRQEYWTTDKLLDCDKRLKRDDKFQTSYANGSLSETRQNVSPNSLLLRLLFSATENRE